MDPLAMQNFDVGMSGSPLAARRAHSSMSGRYPRSWHPSPFASDDDASSDEPQFFKEEKKNRIKMEIARRRQQIEENACLHDELTRLARLRENAEITDRLHPSATSQVGLYGNSPGMYSPAIMSGVAGAGTGAWAPGAVAAGCRAGPCSLAASALTISAKERACHAPTHRGSMLGRCRGEVP